MTILMRWNWARASLSLACGAALLVGCDDGKVEIRGLVQYEEKPLEEGMITFEPADGKGPSTGEMIANGKYELTGDKRAMPGDKIVRIVGMRATGRKVPAGSPSPPGTMIDEVIQCIPANYNDQTTLNITVTPGKANTHDFDLKLAGER